MTYRQFLNQYPGRRIDAFDGMAVTADLWREAHEFHAFHQRLHAVASHGPGIIAGLEVIASEPPSQTVYILPGIAVDPDGHTVVVPKPAAFDTGRYRDGVLHLLLTYDEDRSPGAAGTSAPADGQNGQYGNQPFFIHTGYSVEAVVGRVDSPQVELARIDRQGQEEIVRDAADFRQPGRNEIDLRFRPEVRPVLSSTLLVGVAYLSRMNAHSHGFGLNNLARTVSVQPELRVWVNDDIDLTGDLSEYTLIVLVAKDEFQLTVDEVNSLYAFLRRGGTLFVESCHREGGTNPASDGRFAELMESLGVQTEAVKLRHPLLQEPFLFSLPPSGYETGGAPSLRAGDGVVLSTFDYGCLWRGDRRNGPASREEIRASMEWGHNLLIYAWNRRRASAQV